MGFAAIAALSLGASAMSSSPAQAREFDHRAPMAAAHHASYFLRSFFGYGHPWHHGDHRWR
jgi:hypothetical protein